MTRCTRQCGCSNPLLRVEVCPGPPDQALDAETQVIIADERQLRRGRRKLVGAGLQEAPNALYGVCRRLAAKVRVPEGSTADSRSEHRFAACELDQVGRGKL